MGFIAWGIAGGVSYLHAVEDLIDVQALGSAASPEALAQAKATLMREQRLFWIPIIFDPVTLLYFASVYPRRNRLHRALILVPFALVALGLLVIDVVAPITVGAVSSGQHVGPFAGTPVRATLTGYMLAAYLLVLAGLVDLLWSSGVTRQRARLLLIGMGIAVFTRVGLVLEDFPALGWLNSVSPLPLAVNVTLVRGAELLLALAVFFAFYAVARRRAPETARAFISSVHRATLLGVLGIGVVWLATPVAMMVISPDSFALASQAIPLQISERTRYSARWLVFGSVVGYSILRFQLFDLPTRARRAMLHTALLWGLLAAFAVLALIMAGTLARAAQPALLLVVSVAAAVVILLVYEGAKKSLSRYLREPDAAEVRARKMEVYRAGVESTPEQTERLEALRAELGLTDEEARTVELLARAPRAGGPLGAGVVVGGRYGIERLLGRGGGGRVFLARDALIDRLVVLKELDGGDDKTLQRALAEAKNAGGLSHPHVVVLHDTLLWGGRQLLVMEYVPGGTLAEHLQERGRLPPGEATRVLRGVLSGLAAVHASGITHGDVKPSNVLLASDGTPKLSDFGISSLQRHGTRGIGGEGTAHALTLRYAPPEVVAGGRPDARSDVYSAALVFADALLGLDAPGTASERMQAACAMLPPRAGAGLAAAASQDPGARPADAGAMLAAME